MLLSDRGADFCESHRLKPVLLRDHDADCYESHSPPRRAVLLSDRDADLSAVAAAAERGCGDAGAYDEPVSVAAQAEPEAAAFRSSECGIALTGDGGEFESVVACVLLCG